MISYDSKLRELIIKFSGKYRIKHCNYFKYDIDKEAIEYHIGFCTRRFNNVPEKAWREIFYNNNDNKNGWPSIFRKKEKTDKENEIIRKFIGRWREDSVISPFVGLLTRS